MSLLGRLYARLEVWVIGPEVPLPGTPGGSEDICLWADHPTSLDFSELPSCRDKDD